MFDLPPKCPALANKLTGIFGWRHTYRVQQKHKDLNHLKKSYSLSIPRKIIVEDPHSWVVVHHLQSQSGILDPDDCVNDVADDREQILASFDDCPEPNVPQGGGDGASGSSVGTGSPDIFRGVNSGNLKRVYPEESSAPINELAKYGDDTSNSSRTHIEVTDSVSPLGLGLQVRRSSDPSIPQTIVQSECNQRSPLCQCPTHDKQQQESMKRWSAAPVCRRDTDSPAERILANVANNSANYLTPPASQWPNPPNESIESQGTSPGTSFSRSGRLSMQFLGESAPGYRWMEAAEKVAANLNQSTGASFNSKSLPRDLKRKEPLGQAYESMRDKRDTEMLLVINEQGGGPLGLTAIPDLLNGGLLVQSVEPGSRAERGRLQKGDRILEINGTKLAGMTEASLQSYVKKNLASSELRVRVSTANRGVLRKKEMKDVTDGENRIPTKVATVSPNRKIAGAPVTNSLQAANTRKLGRRIEIVLKKGGHGLGFSVTTRDNPTGGHCPIYIKNILPRGAAIESGKLKPGDRLLEVDGIAMTGKTQSEVVSILRATQLGATVNIVVSRQNDLEEIDEREVKYEAEKENNEGTPPKPPPPVLPQKPQKSPSVKSLGHSEGKNSLGGNSTNSSSAESSAGTFSWRNREIITLHIPVHDTERAGLGVSVKGKTGSSSNNCQTDGDLGIFVKSVLHGGAASRDGRLKMNDQLLSVNGVSLLGQSNADAMETLRRAMLHTGGKFPGVITLSVARKISRPSSMGDLLEATGVTEKANATVIYLNCEPQTSRKEDNAMEMWNNPVVERLTGGVEMKQPTASSSPYAVAGLRNESYYMATKDATWSPLAVNNNHINYRNNSILIEEDSEPTSPTIPNRPQYQSMASADSNATLTSASGDVTYSSQLSLEPPNGEAFSRDAVGRRSISEKHHAALDARETGTYQRNKKLREDRERERKAAMAATGSVESLGKMGRDAMAKKKKGSNSNVHASEAMDRVTDLGPSLGLKKSSSLESLQTMVHEIQMADEPRGPNALRTPRGRGREEILRAAVESPPDEEATSSESRKKWLLDYDGPDMQTIVNRNSPLQSSMSSGKQKRSGSGKKSSLLKGIGHMFRFGKHRKDGIAPAETMSALSDHHQRHAVLKREPPPKPYNGGRPLGGPPGYQPPPAPAEASTGNDHFFQRYRPGFKYDDQQEQMSSHSSDQLSESTLTQMRQQVMHQRVKVEEESRNHQQYQSQRSVRTVNAYPASRQNSRPISSYYEYETLQFPADSRSECGWKNGPGMPVAGRGRQWNGVGGSTRSRGPFITQVTIRQPHQPKSQNSQPSSKV